MAQNWLRITHQDDKIQLSWQRGYESPRFAPEVGFPQPFDEENAAELRWYLEDYLKFPYGIFPDNAVKIEQKLQHWGQHLFELVFHSTEKGREFFQEATREGLDNCELGIISDNAEVLNLPWELLYSPEHKFYLSIACDRAKRTTLKSDRTSFCQKVVMLRLNVTTLSLNLMILVINVVTLSLNVVALSLNVIALSLKVIRLSLKVIALSLNVIALRLNVVMLVTTRHSLITAIVDSRTNKLSLGNFLGDIDSGK